MLQKGQSSLSCLTMDSLMSSSSRASSVFSCGQNKLQEDAERKEDGESQKDAQRTNTPVRVRAYFSPEYTRGRRLRL